MNDRVCSRCGINFATSLIAPKIIKEDENTTKTIEYLYCQKCKRRVEITTVTKIVDIGRHAPRKKSEKEKSDGE